VYGLILSMLYGIIYGLAFALAPESTYETYEYENGFGYSYSANASLGFASSIVIILGLVVLFVVAAVIQSAYMSGALDIVNGRPVTIGSFFTPRNVGNVIIAGLIVGILAAIGYVLCVIPGIAVGIFTMFTIVALLDRNLAPIDAIKASFEIAKANFGQVLLTWLVMAAIAAVGALLCGVGLIVAIPVAVLVEVYAWRRLSGGQVAPPAIPQPLPPGPPPQFGQPQ